MVDNNNNNKVNNNKLKENNKNNNTNIKKENIISVENKQPKGNDEKINALKALKIKQHKAKQKEKKKSVFKIMFLGGIEEIGKNLTVIEHNNEMVIVDAGMTFPTADMPGVEVIIPDMTYLVENSKKIKGLLLTHGHEDHIGAVPYLIRSIPNIKIYGSKLTLSLVEHKCRENKLVDTKLIVVDDNLVQKVGNFEVEFVKVTHSISGSYAIAITASGQTIFITGDFKMDYTPVDGQIMDFARLSEIGKRKVLLMLGESTNVERPGSTMSETTVGIALKKIFDDNISKRIIIATFASNVHRIQQIIDLAEKCGRRVSLSGRSMKNIAEMAGKIGALKCNPNTLVDLDKIGKIPDDKLVIIATGSQGEPMSALSKMADGSFSKLTIGKNDTVILSSSPIPGNERSVYSVINNLYRLGADVIYNTLTDVHVSGHACQEELKLMLALIKPTFFMPIHGEYRHLKLHAKLAESMNIKPENILLPEIGGEFTIRFSPSLQMYKSGTVTAGNMFVDGLMIDDTESTVLKDRKRLAEDGFLIIVVGVSIENGTITTGPDIIYRGMCSIESYTNMLKDTVIEIVNKNAMRLSNKQELKFAIINTLSRQINKIIKQRPMIMPIIIEN